MTASLVPCSLRAASSIAFVIGLCGITAASSACSVILKPRDDVERCGTAEDCSPTGDNRYEPVCKFDDDNLDLDSTKVDKICVADFRSIGCDPMQYSGQSAKNMYLETFETAACVDLGCAMENLGTLGCPPPSGEGCAAGLELDDDGNFCNDPDADERVIPASYLAANDLEGQHIKDQFCKSFFCDDDFVCNSDTNKCQPCDPDLDFGEGGCGLVYSEGALAKIYVLGDALEEQCAGEEVDVDEVPVFGACS